jgi:hypothetical protein
MGEVMSFTQRQASAWSFAMVLAAACSGSSDSGSASGAGGTGGAGGMGGAGGVTARACGNGAPCTAGGVCSYSGLESGVNCECDPSGHFLCDTWAAGGAPPYYACNTETACAVDLSACPQSNGFCTRSCTCGGSCDVQCAGDGPAEGDPGISCGEAYCQTNFGALGGCAVKDNSCDYEVKCMSGVAGVLGSCPGG